MQNIQIVSGLAMQDQGGKIDLAQFGAVIMYEGVKYTYKASGLCRDVFFSEDKKTVLKLPKKGFKHDVAMEHNKLEVQAYNEAPDWCKKHIAASRLTEEGYEIQEAVRVEYPGGYFRELGFREDGTVVIFDCDILCDPMHIFERPDDGFRYIDVFKLLSPTHEVASELEREATRQKNLSRICEELCKHYPDSEVSTKDVQGKDKFYVTYEDGTEVEIPAVKEELQRVCSTRYVKL